MSNGKIGFFELGLYTTIYLRANFKTGIYWGSAPKLHAEGFRGVSLRDIQRGLQVLVQAALIRSFHRHGRRGNYPILIDDYLVRTGALKERRLKAHKSESWGNPCYEACADGAHGDRELHTKKEIVALRTMTTNASESGHSSNTVPHDCAEADTDESTEAAPIQDTLCITQTKTQSPSITEDPLCAKVLAVWNRDCGVLPKVHQLTAGRCKKLLARAQANPSFLSQFELAVQKAAQTPFLRGEGAKGWRASFDWVIQDDSNLIRILEGAYEEAPYETRISKTRDSSALAPKRGKYANRKPDAVIN